MPVFGSALLDQSAPFPSFTPAARHIARWIIASAKEHSPEDALISRYRRIAAAVLGAVAPPRDSPLFLSAEDGIDFAARPGPALAWEDSSVRCDAVRRANACVDDGTVDEQWGFRLPDLGYLAGSADRSRFLVAATGEIKAAPVGAHPGGAWAAALAQEAMYTFTAAEMYGAGTGLVGVGTQICRLVVQSWAPTRTLVLEVSPELHARLTADSDSLPLESLMEHVKEFGGRVGALDLCGPDDDIDEAALQRLWDLLYAAACSIASVDGEVKSPLSGDAPGFEGIEVSASDELQMGSTHARGEVVDTSTTPETAALSSPASTGPDPGDVIHEPEGKGKRASLTPGDAERDAKRPLAQGGLVEPQTSSSARATPPTASAPAATQPVRNGVRTPPQPAGSAASTHCAAQTYTDAWVTAQTGQHVRSRALYHGRVTPDGSEATSDGSLVEPERLVDLVAALRITVRPVLVQEMDALLAAPAWGQAHVGAESRSPSHSGPPPTGQ